MGTAVLARGLMAAACWAFALAAQAGQVVIGQVAPLSGFDALQGRGYAAGMQLAFDAANKAGAAGHSFTLVSADDGGRPADTLSATGTLLAQHKPLALGGYFGSQNLAELLKAGVLERERIALVGYRAGDLRLENKHLYGVRAGLREEIVKISEHLSTVGITRLGLFHEEGPAAAALVTVMEDAAKRNGQQLLARGTYAAGTVQIGRAVEAFLDKAPQAIVMVATGAAAAGFIEQYRLDGGTAQLLAQSGVDVEQLTQRLGEHTIQGIAIAQVVPNPYRISSTLAKEFSDAVAARKGTGLPPSYAMMEGFIVGKVIVEAARRMGARVSREGFTAALDAMENYEMGGYRVGYRPGQKTGSRFVELSIISSAGRIRQ